MTTAAVVLAESEATVGVDWEAAVRATVGVDGEAAVRVAAVMTTAVRAAATAAVRAAVRAAPMVDGHAVTAEGSEWAVNRLVVSSVAVAAATLRSSWRTATATRPTSRPPACSLLPNER